MIGYSGGGSDQSLFLHLTNLNRSSFIPYIVYKQKSNLVEKLKSLDFILIKPNFFASQLGVKKVVPKIKIPGIKTITYNVRVLREVFSLIRIIRNHKIDIIHINNNIISNRAAAIAGILTFRKIIVHDRMGIQLGGFDRFLLKYVTIIIAISESVQKKYFGVVDREKVRIVYNGLDTRSFKKLDANKSSDFVIGCVGRLVSWKGVEILIKALPKVLKHHSNIKVVIVGEGGERNKLEKLVTHLNMSETVNFLGNRENVQEIYSSMDLFIHTAIEPEPFGRVIIEAMSCELPIISTNIGGPKEIITHGFDGYLIEPGDSDILSDQIFYLIENPKVRSQISKNALLTVENKFDISMTTQLIENIYDTI